MTTFVQQSANNGAGGSASLAAHGSGAIGDVQIVAVACHASLGAGAIAGWTLLSNTATAHSRLQLFTRTLDAGNVGTGVTVNWGGSYGRITLRTYRSAGSFVVAGSGSGLVSASTAVNGVLVRFTASAENNNSSFPPVKTLTADAALVNPSSGSIPTYEWYDGLVAGDDPTASGGTAPTRTATSTGGGDIYPQWVDVNIVSATDRRAAGVVAETLIQSDAPERRVAGLTAETLVQSNNIQRNVAGVVVEVLSKVPRRFIGWGNPVR